MVPTLIDFANSAGGLWTARMIAASLDSALLLALIGLTWPAVRRRVAPQVGYGLFLLVPLKLLIPLAVTVPAAWAIWTPSSLVLSHIKDSPGVARVDRGDSASLFL